MIHLDCKSDFSFLKAYGSPDQIVKRAVDIGASAVGLSDLYSTWGHIPFYKVAKKANIKPILGVTIPVVANLEKDPRHDLVTLVAQDAEGLREQYDMLSMATSQFYYRPRLTWAQLQGVKKNYTIVTRFSPTSITYIGSLPQPIIGVGPTPGYALKFVSDTLVDVAVSCSPLYPTLADEEAYRLMVSIGDSRRVMEIDRIEQFMFREGELRAKFVELGIPKAKYDKWLARTLEIATACNVALPQGQNVRPGLDITLEQWCKTGAKKRGINLNKEPYKARYKRELALIHDKGFVDYFLLIGDLIAWAKERMFVGPARGSSAGSLVCYLMEIVEVDPIKHNLLFERFIDINRKDLPDIDIDFPDERRSEVFDYIIAKYGHERVARIGTVSVFKPKSAINDVGKSYNIPPWETKKLTDVMVERSGGDARANMCIEDTIAQFDIGKELVKKFPKILMASKIEGHARHTGIHAAGVIVSNDPVRNYCAINHREDADIAMINKNDAEAIGLLKIDALGLKTLSVLQDCCDMVGVNPRDLYTLPLTIREAFIPFQQDRVAGIFQFEGYAVRSLMRQMGVENFGDITALTALARPGPLHCGAANQFIARRIGSEDWEYGIEQLKPHVSFTFGTIVYQEQVMSITRDLGDMDWQDVSALRKAMSKSLGEEFFNQYKIKFLTGTDKKGIDRAKAEVLWQNMCTFGSWAFNLSHAVSYAMISYWCAYLKQKYPLEFAVAHLRRTDSEDHVLRLLRELIKEGFSFVPFDPDKSEMSWSIKEGKIYGGFTSVKGVGPVTATKIEDARRKSPDDWKSQITPTIRGKLFAPNNTPWHGINRIEKLYGKLYSDPDSYITSNTPRGIRGPVIKVEDIKEVKGNYCFLGKLVSRNLRDLNETQSLVKRGGVVIEHHNLFLNLIFEDDTGSILATINRFKYPTLGIPLMEEQSDGKDFLVRGNIIEDGQRKIYIERIVRLN